MEWEDKVQTVQLGNSRNSTPEANCAFMQYVEDHVEKFDLQAWDMFLHLICFVDEEWEEFREVWEKVHREAYKLLNSGVLSDTPMQFDMRFGTLIQFLEDELNLET